MVKKLDGPKQPLTITTRPGRAEPIKTAKLLRAQQQILAPLQDVAFPCVCEVDTEDSGRERNARWRLEFYNLSEDTAANLVEVVADWYKKGKRRV
jgi:hypothetical protein